MFFGIIERYFGIGVKCILFIRFIVFDITVFRVIIFRIFVYWGWVFIVFVIGSYLFRRVGFFVWSGSRILKFGILFLF